MVNNNKAKMRLEAMLGNADSADDDALCIALWLLEREGKVRRVLDAGDATECIDEVMRLEQWESAHPRPGSTP